MKRKIILATSMIVFFLAIYFLLMPIIKPLEGVLPKEHRPLFLERERYIPLPIFWLSGFLLFFGTIFFSYWYFSRKMERKFEEILEFMKKLNKKEGKGRRVSGNKKWVLEFLNVSERRVVEKLIENNGSAFQSQLNRIEGMNKLKVHRAVRELVKKGIVSRSKIGKTYKINLNEKFKKLLVE